MKHSSSVPENKHHLFAVFVAASLIVSFYLSGHSVDLKSLFHSAYVHAVAGTLNISSTTGLQTFNTVGIGGSPGAGAKLVIVGGNVGLGTTAPKNALDINGGLAVGSYAGVNTAPSNGVIISGNVGIGTTNPLVVLDARGVLSNASTFPYNIFSVDTASMAQDVGGGIGFAGNDGSSINRVFGLIQGGKENSTSANQQGYLRFFTRPSAGNPAEAMRINSSGNVGIGTTNPTTPLQVQGTVYSTKTGTAGYRLYNGGATAEWEMRQKDSSTHQLLFSKLVSSIYTDYMAIDTGGNVGIGTTNPKNALDINGGLAVGSYAGANTAPPNGVIVSGSVGIGVTNIGTTNIGNTSADYKLDVRTIGTGVPVNVGTNTTAGFAGIHFRNSAVSTTTALAHVGYGGAASGSLSNVAYFGAIANIPAVLTTNDTERMRIDAGGNVGIGTTNPGQALDVVGTIRQSNCKTAGTLSANTSGDIICTSDERLKNIYGYYGGGLAELSAISPIRFSYKGENFIHVGFSAQNVKSVLPEASALQDSGYWSLDDTSVTALTINAIKELNKKVDAQQKQIDDLKKELQLLKNRK